MDTTESLGGKLDRLKEQAKGAVSSHPVVGAAAVVLVGAVGAYFLWPVASSAVAMMKASGAGGLLVSCVAFEAKRQLYFKLPRVAFEAKRQLYFKLPRTAAVVIVGAVVVVGAVGAYFLWPVAAPALAMMKAPGAGGLLVSRVAFEGKRQLCFKLLRTLGVAAAVIAMV